MVKINAEDIKKLGKISQMSIHDDEIDLLAQKLQAVLSYAENLKDIAAQCPAAELPRNSNILRADVAIYTPNEPLLSAAPEREENFFVVPTILK